MINIFRKNKHLKLDISPVEHFDIKRYLGLWYEIARFDNRFERGLTDVSAEYSLKENGTIMVENSGRNEKKGFRSKIIGHAKTTSISGLLRVSFFWNFYSDYRVLMLDDDYQWALVGSGNQNYLWILSRNKILLEDTINIIIAEAMRRGFDVSRLKFNRVN